MAIIKTMRGEVLGGYYQSTSPDCDLGLSCVLRLATPMTLHHRAPHSPVTPICRRSDLRACVDPSAIHPSIHSYNCLSVTVTSWGLGISSGWYGQHPNRPSSITSSFDDSGEGCPRQLTHLTAGASVPLSPALNSAPLAPPAPDPGGSWPPPQLCSYTLSLAPYSTRFPEGRPH